MKTALLTAVVLLGALLAAGLAVIYSGRYSVAAAEPHAAIELWALETAKRSSVSSGAEGIAVPPRRRPATITITTTGGALRGRQTISASQRP